jgi:hypothetical protein
VVEEEKKYVKRFAPPGPPTTQWPWFWQFEVLKCTARESGAFWEFLCLTQRDRGLWKLGFVSGHRKVFPNKWWITPIYSDHCYAVKLHLQNTFYSPTEMFVQSGKWTFFLFINNCNNDEQTVWWEKQQRGNGISVSYCTRTLTSEGPMIFLNIFVHWYSLNLKCNMTEVVNFVYS